MPKQIKNTILWVEDRTTSIFGFVEKVREKNEKITHEFATKLQQAIQKIDNVQYKLIVLDLSFHEPLPDTLSCYADIYGQPSHNQGQYLAKWIDENHSKQRYLFLTAVPNAYINLINEEVITKLVYDKNEILPSKFLKIIEEKIND